MNLDIDFLKSKYYVYLKEERKISNDSYTRYKRVIDKYFEFIGNDITKMSNYTISKYSNRNKEYKTRVIKNFIKFHNLKIYKKKEEPKNNYIEKFINAKHRVADSTILSYSKFIKQFLRDINKDNPFDVTKEDVDSFITGTITRKRSRLYAIKKFFEFYEIDITINENSYFRKNEISNNRIRNQEDSYLTDNEIRKVKKYLENDDTDYDTVLNKVVLYTCISLGTRLSELISLQVKDINFETGKIHIIEGKGGKDRFVRMNIDYIKFIKKYIETYKLKPNDYIVRTEKGFPYKDGSLSNRMRKVFEKTLKIRTENRKISLHKLRHTFATILDEAGINIRTISKVLGHKNISTTEIYANAKNHDKNLKKNYSNIKPFI